MKSCPTCGRSYADDNLTTCFDDGTELVSAPEQPRDQNVPKTPSSSQPELQSSQSNPLPKSNKKLWIILGIVIGVVVLVMGGCVACVAILGTMNPTTRSTPLPIRTPAPPQIEYIGFRLDEGNFSHDVYFYNEGSIDLHEVNISISLTGEQGDVKTETRYFAVWNKNQEQKISFQVGNSPKNVQKISIKGSCKEGEINRSFAPKNQREIEITVINENCVPQDFYVDGSLAVSVAANSTAKLRITTGKHLTKACGSGGACGTELVSTFSEETTKQTISRSPTCSGN